MAIPPSHVADHLSLEDLVTTRPADELIRHIEQWAGA